MTQRKPVIQRTNIISFKTAEFSFLIKKIDVLRVKKINREKIKQIYKALQVVQKYNTEKGCWGDLEVLFEID